MSDALGLEPGACPNCTAPRAGLYCSACGQKAAPLNPSLRFFLHELAHELLDIDGKIFRSVRLLVTRPGFLTREIFAGRRASYVSPVRLYLIFSIFAFAVGAAVPTQFNASFTASPGETLTQAQLEIETTVEAAINDWLPRAMFVLVPLFAALVMLVRRKTGLNYPQHLYFALHFHAFWFLLRGIASMFGAVGDFAGTSATIAAHLLSIGYLLVSFRGVYGTTFFGTLWRCGTVVVLYMIGLIITLIAIALPFMLAAYSGSAS